MVVQMNNSVINLDDRLTEYGFTPEYARLINRLADKELIDVEDVWYITGEFWNLQKGTIE